MLPHIHMCATTVGTPIKQQHLPMNISRSVSLNFILLPCSCPPCWSVTNGSLAQAYEISSATTHKAEPLIAHKVVVQIVQKQAFVVKQFFVHTYSVTKGGEK